MLTDPWLVLKATPPRVSRLAVVRQRLSSNNPALADKSCIVVEAPSGFGKSTLLAQWRREALERGSLVGWLTADAGDTPLQLLAGLKLAMKVASGRPAFGQIATVPSGDDDGALDGITEWLSEVALMGAESLMIIDDAHLLPEVSVSHSLAYLVQNAPANLRVIFGLRTAIALPVSDHAAHGRFAAFSQNDLRLHLTETMALLNGRFGTRIDANSCARLHELTEGWPLGLQLAIATIEKQGNLRTAIDAISARSGDMRRYFVECLIDRLSPDLAQFLMHISVSEEVCTAFCNAATKRDDSSNLLARLTEATPIFSRSIDGNWLRLHPLARDFLLERFALLPDEERQAIHRRAASWFAEHAMFEAAAHQYLAAGENAMAYDLADRGLFDVIVSGQVARASEWLDRLPAEEIRRRPKLRLCAGWLLALSDRHAEVAPLVGAMVDDPGLGADDRCEAALICGAAAYFADDLAAVARINAPWMASRNDRSPLIRGLIINQNSALLLYSGAPERARLNYLNDMPSDVTGLGYLRGWADWQIGVSYLWEGLATTAETILTEALERAEAASGRRSPVAVMIASALGAALWELNRPEEAAAVLANRLDVLEKRSGPDAIIMGVVTAARLAMTDGSERQAFDLLANLSALGETRGLLRLCVASLAEQIRLHALRSRSETCASLLARLEALPLAESRAQWGDVAALVDIQIGISRAYAAIARNDWSGVLAALDEPGQLANQRRRGRDVLQILLLRALAHKRMGDDHSALLTEAVSLAGMGGLDRVLLDTHPDLVTRASLSDSGEAAIHLSAGGKPEPKPSELQRLSVPKVLPSSLLTPKEQQTLQLLATGMSNKQIALALGISDETVKWHFKNIFIKLGAGTRRHALDRARMLGILETSG